MHNKKQFSLISIRNFFLQNVPKYEKILTKKVKNFFIIKKVKNFYNKKVKKKVKKLFYNLGICSVIYFTVCLMILIKSLKSTKIT